MDLLEFQPIVEQLLAPELGTLPGGMPAIWVDSGDTPGRGNGLLCLIDRMKNMVFHRGILNNQAEQNFDWVIRLVQYDRSPTGYQALDVALDKLRARFPNHRERPLPSVDGVYPQVTFLCNFNVLINTYVQEKPHA